jgi:lipopolysaccharide biosynthesis glycosyltransferase
MSRPVDILLCFDRRFLLGAAVTIRSITENACPSSSLRFHIFSPDLDDDAQKRLADSAMARVPRIQTFSYRIDPSAFSDLLRSKQISHTAYARLFAAEILDASITELIYVDADVLFARDVCELMNIPLNGKVLAAVPNGSLSDQQKNLQRLGVAAESYFASGLMVIDLARWRREQVGIRALQFAHDAGDRLVLHDQDALNGVIRGEFVPLPTTWCHWASESDAIRDAVIHYAMTPKPWDPDYQGGYRDQFFECLDRTPFAGWRPARWFGLAPILARAARALPYPPTVLRILREKVTAFVDT